MPKTYHPSYQMRILLLTISGIQNKWLASSILCCAVLAIQTSIPCVSIRWAGHPTSNHLDRHSHRFLTGSERDSQGKNKKHTGTWMMRKWVEWVAGAALARPHRSYRYVLFSFGREHKSKALPTETPWRQSTSATDQVVKFVFIGCKDFCSLDFH